MVIRLLVTLIPPSAGCNLRTASPVVDEGEACLALPNLPRRGTESLRQPLDEHEKHRTLLTVFALGRVFRSRSHALQYFVSASLSLRQLDHVDIATRSHAQRMDNPWTANSRRPPVTHPLRTLAHIPFFHC